jgi:hypothetical protein
MKTFFFFFVLLSWSSVISQISSPKSTIQDFFVSFHQKDTSELRGFFHDAASIQTVVTKNDSTMVRVEKVGELVRGIGSIPENILFEERISRYKVHSDGEIAQVWTPYEFWVNGKKSHEGVNSFVLVKEDGFWKIIHLIDTRRK